MFIAFEGIDGSGKSTQTKLLSERLTKMGQKVFTTFEPTNGPIGSMIRNIMKGELKADHRTIAGLFVADRLDHLLNEDNGMIKMLREGYTVITDRYYFSSYAYHGTHMDMDWVIKANSMSAEILRPHVNIFIDVPPETSMERLENRGATELYETLENLKNVRQKYYDAFDLLKQEETIIIIDGDHRPQLVADEVWKNVSEMLEVTKTAV
jgi:dTMP kinase